VTFPVAVAAARKSRHLLARFLVVLVTLSMATLICLEVYQIALRYVFSASISWGREVSGLLLFALAWSGLPLLWLQRSHLGVVLFTRSPEAERRLAVALDVLAFGAGVILTAFMWRARRRFCSLIDLPSGSAPTSGTIRCWWARPCLWSPPSSIFWAGARDNRDRFYHNRDAGACAGVSGHRARGGDLCADPAR
jgi:TRAP-type C4-dicarboxylate transport system permease small subunit